MAGWRTHSGTALALPLENVDTDQLIPARFMSVPRSEGYGAYLLHDLRYDPQGAALKDMPLNRHPGASILVSLRNFGCGSSREAAVYALYDAGFRAVIAPSFGDIFAGNAVNNGLLPARVSEACATRLIDHLDGGTADAKIDLERGEIVVGDLHVSFELDDTWRRKLIMGWDDIDLTRAEAGRIAAYRKARRDKTPWAWPSEPD